MIKIARLAGLNIREKDVIAVTNALEQADIQQENKQAWQKLV